MADLSPSQVAERTGLSRTLIYREIERRHLRAYKFAGSIERHRVRIGAWAASIAGTGSSTNRDSAVDRRAG
jgi:excisionase family DNA binding protein